MPALERGLAASGRSRDNFEISFPAMTAVGLTDSDIEREREAYRPRLAFYASTPAYRLPLDAHGWGDVQPELNRLSKTGDWKTMSTLITDDMLDAFVTFGTPDTIAAKLRDRYAGIVDRASVNPVTGLDDDAMHRCITSFHTLPS